MNILAVGTFLLTEEIRNQVAGSESTLQSLHFLLANLFTLYLIHHTDPLKVNPNANISHTLFRGNIQVL